MDASINTPIGSFGGYAPSYFTNNQQNNSTLYGVPSSGSLGWLPSPLSANNTWNLTDGSWGRVSTGTDGWSPSGLQSGIIPTVDNTFGNLSGGTVGYTNLAVQGFAAAPPPNLTDGSYGYTSSGSVGWSPSGLQSGALPIVDPTYGFTSGGMVGYNPSAVQGFASAPPPHLTDGSYGYTSPGSLGWSQSGLQSGMIPTVDNTFGNISGGMVGYTNIAVQNFAAAPPPNLTDGSYGYTSPGSVGWSPLGLQPGALPTVDSTYGFTSRGAVGYAPLALQQFASAPFHNWTDGTFGQVSPGGLG